MNDALTQLTELLAKLPGIGPRQSRRLAFWFVRQDSAWVDSFARVLLDARKTVKMCSLCGRLYPHMAGRDMCNICTSGAREASTLMLVERDVDLENIERTGSYKGRYFILGGTTGPLDKHPERHIRIAELLKRISRNEEPVREIIYALSATTEGEDTGLYLDEKLKSVSQEKNITISRLGRGLSTGTELEYVDKETMDHALRSRK